MQFRKPTVEDCKEIEMFKEEFLQANSGMDGTGILYKSSASEWLEYNQKMEQCSLEEGIPSLQYGLFDEENHLLGLLQIRLVLKGYLVTFGGHIGYCVRPSERRKGYAKKMLQEALVVCKERGLSKVLVTCLENNVGSSKTIEACGGILESVVFDAINYQANMKRYWITL